MIEDINFKLDHPNCASGVRGPFFSLRLLKRTNFGAGKVYFDD